MWVEVKFSLKKPSAMTPFLQIRVYSEISDTYGSQKICPLLRGVRYWEVI